MAAAKSNLLLALGMPKKGVPSDEGDKEEADTGGEAKRSAAQALIDATKRGDAGAVVSAFESLYEACSMGGAHSAEEEDEGDEEEEY
jgi:hypothetical protein